MSRRGDGLGLLLQRRRTNPRSGKGKDGQNTADRKEAE